MVLVIITYLCDMKNYIKYNGELKRIDTQEKAYLLGIIFGDGHVSSIKRYKVQIATTIKDEEIFLKLNKLFPFLRKTSYKSYPNVLFLVCGQKELVNDLIGHGCVPNKVKADKEFKFNFPKINNKLIPHFIRGFFDADGSVYTQTRYRSRNGIKTEISLSTKNFLLQLNNILELNNIFFKFIEREKSAGNNKKYKTYTILSSNRENSLKFAEFIYKDATLFLERKHLKFYTYIKSPLQIRRESFPPCTLCEGGMKICGNRINKDGSKKLKLKCNNCSKMISVPM